jgi:hypothetical protein
VSISKIIVIRQTSGSLEAVGSIARRFPGDLVISKRKLRQAEAVQIVRLHREARRKNLGFASRPFVLCGLPIKRPPRGALIHERRNGHFLLQVTVERRLDLVRALWPSCAAAISADGDYMPIQPAIALATKGA